MRLICGFLLPASLHCAVISGWGNIVVTPGSEAFDEKSGDLRGFALLFENPHAEQDLSALSGLAVSALLFKGDFPEHIPEFTLIQRGDINKFARSTVECYHGIAHLGKVRCSEFFSAGDRRQMRFQIRIRSRLHRRWLP